MLQQAPPALVQELTAYEEKLASTYQSHDCDAWAALLADEWSMIHLTGVVLSKKDAVAICRGIPELTSRLEQLTVRSYGTMAIVTGINNASAATSPPTAVRVRFMDVFIKRNDKWIVVASEITPMPALKK